MQRYKMVLAYDGAPFHGWQRQPDVKTIQSELESALSTILRTPISTTSAGRTDTGVHALGQVVHFDAEPPSEKSMEHVQNSLNGILRPHIRIRSMEAVPDRFHARHSALERSYLYQIDLENLPWRRFTHWQLTQPINLPPVLELSAKLLGEHDFSAFCSAEADNLHALCFMHRFDWIEKEEGYQVLLTANRFLHTMVRSLVGMLVRVGQGRLSEDQFLEIWRSGDRFQVRHLAPGHGLFLHRVKYPIGAHL